MAETFRFLRCRIYIVSFYIVDQQRHALITIGCSSVTNDGPIFYFQTNEGASQRKLISVDVSADAVSPSIVIPERKDALLCDVTRVNKDHFVVQYKRNVCSFHTIFLFPPSSKICFQVKDEIYICDNNGRELERLYSDFVGTMSAHCRDTHSWLFVTMSGFNTPGTIAYYDFKRPEGQRLTPFRQTKVKGLNPDDFETRQV